MTNLELITCLGQVKEKYILEAKQKPSAVVTNRRSLRPFWLIAAILATAALLMGCAWAVMRMQDLKIGQAEIPVTRAVENSGETTLVPVEVLSLQGLKNSPAYLAGHEWLEFTKTYTPQTPNGWDSPPEYWAYSLLDDTMVAKVDEICAKYGLKILGKPWHEHQDCGEFLKLAGVDSLLNADTQASLTLPQGRFFPGGSFTVYGQLAMPGREMPLFVSIHCVKKDVFSDVFGYVPSDTQERTMETADGVQLLLLEGEQSSMILAEGEDQFLSIGLESVRDVSLEDVANAFDFTIRPKPLPAAAADAREQVSLNALLAEQPSEPTSLKAYVEQAVKSYSPGGSNDGFPMPEYAFYDLDGNGTEDLLMFYGGRVGNVVAMKDGIADMGKIYNLEICEDHVVIDYMETGVYKEWYHIFRFANNDDPVFSNPKEQSIVRLAKDQDGQWWRTSSTDHYAEFDTKITEAEAREILDSYKRIQLDTKPITEFEEPQA